MRRLLAVLALLLGVSTTASAQSRLKYPEICLKHNLDLKHTDSLTKVQCVHLRAHIDSVNLALANARRTPRTPVTPGRVPHFITVAGATFTATVGGTVQLTGTVNDDKGLPIAGLPISWSVFPSTIAAVSGTGIVTGVRAGSALVTASTPSAPGAARSVTILVTDPTPAPNSIAISPTSASLLVGATQTFTGTVLNSVGTVLPGRAIGWSSSVPSVATISGLGVATAQSAGTTSITAATPGYPLASRSVTLTVTAPPTPASIAITPTTPSIQAGSTQQFTGVVKDGTGATMLGPVVTWASNASSVATINASTGLATGVGAGTATITASTAGYPSASRTTTLTVTAVAPVPASIAITPTAPSILVGGTQAFTGVVKDAGGATIAGATVTWASGATSVATINSSTGVATGVSAGGATITANTAGFPSASRSVTLTVTAPDTSTLVGPATVAELPRITPTYAYPTPTRVVSVGAGADLQALINSAQCGDELRLAVGATYTGNFDLPPKGCTGTGGNGWVVLRTNVTDGTLGAQGTRMTPSRAASISLAKIVTTSNFNASLITTDFSAGYWRFTGVEMTTSGVTTLGSLIRFGDDALSQNTGNTAHHLIIDRSYVHGGASTSLAHCLVLNSAYSVVVDSWFGECHGRDGDSQAISGWNGPGPFLIKNNYLEAGDEVIAWGGGTFTVTNGSPSDITIIGNEITRPVSWLRPCCDANNDHYDTPTTWRTKNLLESKHSKRMLVEGNVIHNHWADAQSGYAFLYKSEDQEGDNAWTQTADLTFRYNHIYNVGSAFNFAGKYSDVDSRPSVYSARYTVYDNYIENVNVSPYLAEGVELQLINGIQDVIFRHNTITNVGPNSQKFISMDGNPATRTAIHSNVVWAGQYGIATSLGLGTTGWNNSTTGGTLWNSNIVIGGDCANLPSGSTCPSTYPSSFANGYDGLPIGANKALVDAATANAVVAP